MKEPEFVESVVAILCSEHGAELGAFNDLKPWICAAWATEGHITEDELTTLCCAGDDEEEEVKELETQFPKLTQIFEAVLDGDEPFCLECRQNTRMNQPHLSKCANKKEGE